MARSSQTYVNTMVFAIIAGMVSIALLCTLLLSESLTEYLFAIITIEVGLVAIIIFALYRIIAYEAKMRSAVNNASRNAFAANNCPDYYTLKYSSNGIDQNTCTNMFRGKSPDGFSYVMYFVPSEKFQRTGQGSSVRFLGNPANNSILIKSMETMPIDQACKMVQGLPEESDGKKANPNNYTIPWTDLRPKCESIVYY
jgi:hypothetical protein